MEKRYMERLVGKYCKIVTKEPGEDRATVVTGILEDVDYKDGFILVDSSQGLGCLRIDTIIAIKPGRVREASHKRKIEDDEALVGIGTLIVFIAIILVAAVAASVIIQTSEQLQRRAQRVGAETIREVSSGAAVDDVVGYTNANKTKINYLALSIRPRAGSRDIDLTTCIITMNYLNLTILQLNTSLISPVNLDNKSLFHTPVASGSQYSIADLTTNSTFGIIVANDADNSVMNTQGMNSGDRIYVIMNLSAIVHNGGSWFDSGLPPRGELSGAFQPEVGAKAVYDICTPAVFTNRIVTIW